MKKKPEKNKYFNKDQSSFYFEDFLETNKKKIKSFKEKSITGQNSFIIFFIFFFNTCFQSKNYTCLFK